MLVASSHPFGAAQGHSPCLMVHVLQLYYVGTRRDSVPFLQDNDTAPFHGHTKQLLQPWCPLPPGIFFPQRHFLLHCQGPACLHSLSLPHLDECPHLDMEKVGRTPEGVGGKDHTHGSSLVHTGFCALGAQHLGDISPQRGHPAGPPDLAPARGSDILRSDQSKEGF